MMAIEIHFETKWLKVIEVKLLAKRKTSVFLVATKDEIPIGCIKWLGRWRKYAFFPGIDTAYEQDCLHDLARVLDIIMERHRALQKQRKESEKHAPV
jgi:hypothetical protein